MALEHELFDDLLRFVIQFPIAENRYQITNAYRRALDERDAALSRAEAAERRVAELEAMLLEARDFLAEYYPGEE